MTWLTPLTGFLLAAAVIPPLIVLYFLKLRRRPQAISTTLLWKKSIEDLRANAPFQKLRRSLLLLLQLIALLLLAFSVAQPRIQAGQQKGGKVVLLIDNSASMTSTNVTTPGKDITRLDEAKRRAKEKIEAMYGGGFLGGTSAETMVIVFSDRAEVYSRFTTSKQQLLAAIDRIQPTHGQSRIEDALKLARAYTTNVDPDSDRPIADPAALELFSDGRITDITGQVLRGESLMYHAIGTAEADNVAIATISVERPYDRPTSVEVFVSLLNFNQARVACDMQLSVDDRAVAVEEVAVDAATVDDKSGELIPGRANVVFTPFDQPRGVVIRVANLREDALAADNAAQVVVPPPRRLTVAVVAEGSAPWPLMRSIESAKPERLVTLSPAQFEEQAATGLDQYDVIVLNNYKPAAMPPARYLIFGKTPPIEGLNEYGQGEAQIILTSRDDHPAMRLVSYDKIFIAKFNLVQPTPEVQVLMEGTHGPAIVAVSRGSMQVIYCTFDLMESTWPIERSFVNFMLNAIDFLGHANDALASKSLAPGDAITARLPANATDIELILPDRSTPEILRPLDPTQLAWGPIRLSGLYALSWKTLGSEEGNNRAFAVNMFSDSEGHIGVNPSVAFGQERIAGARSDESVYTPLWPWAIGFCLLVLMTEWWIYHRKAYI